MSKHAPNSKQQNEIYNLLRKHCKSKPGKDGEPDQAVYMEGWSDDQIALAVNQASLGPTTITSVNVERRRREVYGHLATKAPRSNPRHVALEAEVQELKARVTELERVHDGLLEYVNETLVPAMNDVMKKNGRAYVSPQGRPLSTPPS